jgi:hypothetical protein
MKAEMFYILNNHAFNVLAAMSIGLMDNLRKRTLKYAVLEQIVQIAQM